MGCMVVVGGFFGSEGKGKIVAHLALHDKPFIAARGGVGTNAGHTIVFEGKEYRLRQIPSAFVNPTTRLLIGPGVLVHPRVFLEEIKLTRVENRIGLDPQCAIIEESHILRERENMHLSQIVKTTETGCGPCMEDRVRRVAKLARDMPELRSYLTDVALEINSALDLGKEVLVEGTQGTHLSLFHGTYPHCTSKDVTASAICSDVGIGPIRVSDVIVVFKAFVTRSSPAGLLEGELPQGEADRRGWTEITTVSRRQRRVAPFNFKMAKRAVMLNGATQIALTKLDVLFPECQGSRSFNQLPEKALSFVQEVEAELNVPATLIGTGPDSREIIDRRHASSKR